MTVIYFSPKDITIALGGADGQKYTIRRAVSAPLPDGAVTNGVIIDEDALLGAFLKLKSEWGAIEKAELVIDSSHIIYRLSALPKVPKKEMRALVKNEFLSRDMKDREFIYDYSVLQAAGKHQLVMCCAVDKTIIDSYREFFAKAGVAPAKISFGLNAALRALCSSPGFNENADSIYCVVDHYIVTLIHKLPDGGIYFHRARILSEKTDGGYYDEISGIVRSYMQGRKSVDRNEKTDNFYVFDGNAYAPQEYAAFGEMFGFSTVKTGIKTVLNVEGLGDSNADAFLYCLLAFAPLKTKDINFIDCGEREYKETPARTKIIIAAAAVIIIAIGSSAAYLALGYADVSSMKGKINNINDYVSKPSVKAAVDQFNALTDQSSALSARLSELNAYDADASGSAVLQKQTVLDALAEAGDTIAVNRMTFDASSASLTLECRAGDPADVSAYVEKLRESGIFSGIDYSGYSGSSNAFSFSLVCYIGGGADE